MVPSSGAGSGQMKNPGGGPAGCEAGGCIPSESGSGCVVCSSSAKHVDATSTSTPAALRQEALRSFDRNVFVNPEFRNGIFHQTLEKCCQQIAIHGARLRPRA